MSVKLNSFSQFEKPLNAGHHHDIMESDFPNSSGFVLSPSFDGSQTSNTCLLDEDIADQIHQKTNEGEDAVLSTPSANGQLPGKEVVDRTCYLTKEAKLQGIVFVEDAIQYRSIHHKSDIFSIKLYRWYHSAPVQCSVIVATFLILVLAFIEDPSSLSWSTDPRRNQTRYMFPDGFTEGVEIVCLLILTLSGFIQGYISTNKNKSKFSFFRKNPWLTGGYIVSLVSMVDVIISLCLGNTKYRIRVRRLFRPYFLAQNTTMLKKTLKAMWNTLPEIASVLTLLSLLLYFFTMLGMLVFHKQSVNGTLANDNVFNNTEWNLHFNSFGTSLMSLVVLLTTANNPDVMMPAYSENSYGNVIIHHDLLEKIPLRTCRTKAVRAWYKTLYSIYFIVFSLLGTFLVFNLLTAIIYNQFRGYFKCSMQTSYFRRCVALSAAHRALSRVSFSEECNVDQELPNVSLSVTKEILNSVSMTPDQRRLISIAMKDVAGQENGRLDKQSFCALFRNVDSTCHAMLPRRNLPVWSSKTMRSIQRLVLNRYFNVAGNLVVLLNAIMMTVEIAIHYEESFQTVFSRLNIMNYVFVGFYCIEQVLKILSLGKRYLIDLNCLYDGAITILLVCLEIVQLAKYGHNSVQGSSYGLSLWDCARIVNILVLMRLLRVIPNFKPMALVTGVMLEIIRSLKSFAGIIIIIYYVFAIIGMMAFENAISPPLGNASMIYQCGTYQQLQYWANNFDDFASSLVVLWDVMVVNNWGVFLRAFKMEINPWSQAYFVVWWLISSVVCINLFVALILDHFIAKWEGNAEDRDRTQRGTIQSLFQKHLHEPSQERIREELEKHPCFFSRNSL